MITHAQRYIDGLLNFAIADELGHAALNHYARVIRTCDARRALEQDADGFAVALEYMHDRTQRFGNPIKSAIETASTVEVKREEGQEHSNGLGQQIANGLGELMGRIFFWYDACRI